MQLSNLSYKCDNCGASGKLLELFFFVVGVQSTGWWLLADNQRLDFCRWSQENGKMEDRQSDTAKCSISFMSYFSHSPFVLLHLLFHLIARSFAVLLTSTTHRAVSQLRSTAQLEGGRVVRFARASQVECGLMVVTIGRAHREVTASSQYSAKSTTKCVWKAESVPSAITNDKKKKRAWSKCSVATSQWNIPPGISWSAPVNPAERIAITQRTTMRFSTEPILHTEQLPSCMIRTRDASSHQSV